ncbi:hypothetical protein O181_058621 [Austropuccinia psidii MF-1]|uniref:DUF4939 domain-containing protein n=1 Tax=Austropuccinia psidii MF-1 TaxID=1389203 RepID=A0A9Q3HV06_9BASI|nr:hypothetical protein [Austropuccinia psidii MF-1]
MPVQHSPPAKNTRSQRNPGVLTPTERVPLDRTPSVHQLSVNLDRTTNGRSSTLQKRGNELKKIKSEETEVETALEGAPEASEAANVAHSNQPLVSQAEQNFLKMMEQMAQFMGQLTQAVAPRDNSKVPVFKTPSMKAPDSFDGTQAHKLRGFMQSCKLIFHNDPANFFSDRKKVLYSTSFLTGRDGKWIEPYLSNISNEDISYLLNNWQLFETQLFTLFGDPSEVRKAKQELDNLRMKESVHVSLRGLASRLWYQLASYPGSFDTLQELMNINLELDTRYHERQKEKGIHQEKKPPVTGSNSPRPPQNSFSQRPHHKKNMKGKQLQASKDKPHSALLNKDHKLIDYEGREASLEEKLDEEEEPEEIETFLRVVPPAYHQYLDVFSKVKAEKRPPHCACDHHIKLEGLLPPVGVIYSLSNQESEKLWAYISENVEKGFIRPSSSSTGAPVFF